MVHRLTVALVLLPQTLDLRLKTLLLAQDKVNKYKPGLYGKVREVAYRGAEFFWEEAIDKTGGTGVTLPNSPPSSRGIWVEPSGP